MTESATMTAPMNTRSRADNPRRWTIPTKPDLFRREVKELLGGPTEIVRRLEEDGYTVDRKTASRWLTGESDIGLTVIMRLLRLMEVEHERRAAMRQAFYGGG